MRHHGIFVRAQRSCGSHNGARDSTRILRAIPRSHFDSQNYWENGNPGNNVSKDGIFCRTVMESGLANTAPLTGVSFQSSLPLILRGSRAAMTNLSDPNRYSLLGVPNTAGPLA